MNYNILESIYKSLPKVNVTVNDKIALGFFFNKKTQDRAMGENYIQFVTSEKIGQGNIIEYMSREFLVLNVEFEDNEIYRKLYLREMDYIIKVTNTGKAEDIVNLSCVLETNIFGTEGNSIITSATNTINIILPKTEFTYNIDSNSKIVALRNHYKVVGIDTSARGIIILTCDKVAKDSTLDYDEIWEDKDVPIIKPPDEPIEPPIDITYTLEWETIYDEITSGSPIIINVVVRDTINDIIVDDMPVEFSTNAEILEEGFNTITLKAGSEDISVVATLIQDEKEDISITQNIKVVPEEVEDIYTLSITASKNWLWTGESITCQVGVMKNDIPFSGMDIDYSLANPNGSTITSSTNSSVTVRAGMTAPTNFDLIAKLRDYPDVIGKFTIQVKRL